MFDRHEMVQSNSIMRTHNEYTWRWHRGRPVCKFSIWSMDQRVVGWCATTFAIHKKKFGGLHSQSGFLSHFGNEIGIFVVVVMNHLDDLVHHRSGEFSGHSMGMVVCVVSVVCGWFGCCGLCGVCMCHNLYVFGVCESGLYIDLVEKHIKNGHEEVKGGSWLTIVSVTTRIQS